MKYNQETKYNNFYLELEMEYRNYKLYFSSLGYISISDDMNVLVSGGEDKMVKIWMRE